MINKRLISDHHHKFEGFAEGLLGFNVSDVKGLCKFLQENEAVVQFVTWQSRFQTNVNILYGQFKGITYLEKLSSEMNDRLFQLIGDNFAQIVKIDIALDIIIKRIDVNDDDDELDIAGKEKLQEIIKNYDSMHIRYLSAAQQGKERSWYNVSNSIKLTCSYYEDSKFKYQSFLRALVKSFDEVIEALEMCQNYPEIFSNSTHVMIAFWIRLMNSEQV